jgi:hypothetical protein
MTLVKSVHLGGLQLRPETVRIDKTDFITTIGFPDHVVMSSNFPGSSAAFKQVGSGDARHWPGCILDPRLLSPGQKTTKDFLTLPFMPSKDGKGIAMPALRQLPDPFTFCIHGKIGNC